MRIKYIILMFAVLLAFSSCGEKKKNTRNGAVPMENIGFDAAEKGWQLRGSVSPDTCPGSRRFLFEKSLQRIVPQLCGCLERGRDGEGLFCANL